MDKKDDAQHRETGRRAEMKWLFENRVFLEQNYAGKWLAVDGSRLVASGETLSEARAMALRAGVENPFFSAVRSKKYQDVILFRGWR